MKQAFDRIGARPRIAFHSPGSIHAKRLILVEYWKKNALNKEINRFDGLGGVSERFD
jgi:hypothetical protein